MRELSEPMLVIRNLRKSFGPVSVLKGVDLVIQPREVTFLIGPSGGGKSTLLRCINFLEKPTGGEIIFSGERLCHNEPGGFKIAPERTLRAVRSEMPMVFQQFNLIWHRTALENVIEGPVIVKRKPRTQAIEEATELLRRVGLGEKLHSYPDQLSGGQQQRVAIARAVAMRPKLILFDEPTSALDPELVAGVLDTIRALAEAGMTLIVVSHEMRFARKLADTIHFIADGAILESGTAEKIFDEPKSGRLASFIGSIVH
jgi:ABC-type polar amino acid transport system ATPase subunit